MKKATIKAAIDTKYPEGVVLISCVNKNGKINFTPISWATNVSFKPRCWVLCMHKDHFSTKAILETREFVLCFPSKKQAKDVSYCGSVSGWDVDKTKKCRFKLLKAKEIKAPLIENSVACFECKLIEKLKTLDYMIFIGKVLNAYTSKEKKRLFHIGGYKLKTVNY